MELAEPSQQIPEWFRDHARDLPWRRTDDPYEVWVSEIMLQQTRVTTVRDYYESFLGTFPTVEALAEASQDDVLKEWEGLGFYARARRLHKAARKVVDEHGGELPDSRQELKDLPGIGDYTAAVLMALLYDKPTPVVDGNVERVVSRFAGYDQPVDRADTQGRIRGTLEEWLDNCSSPGTLSEGVMELGALVCTPSNPDCGRCPIDSGCEARRRGDQGVIPVRSDTGERPHVDRVVGLLQADGRILLRRRPEDAMLGGLWELPGLALKQDTGRGKQDALEAFLSSELSGDYTVGSKLHTRDHTYSHLEETLWIFEVEETVTVELPENWNWVIREQLADRAMPRVYHEFRDQLLGGEVVV